MKMNWRQKFVVGVGVLALVFFIWNPVQDETGRRAFDTGLKALVVRLSIMAVLTGIWLYIYKDEKTEQRGKEDE